MAGLAGLEGLLNLLHKALHFESEAVKTRPPVHTNMAHLSLADFENGRFLKWKSNRHILKTASCEHSRVMKMGYLAALSKCG